MDHSEENGDGQDLQRSAAGPAPRLPHGPFLRTGFLDSKKQDSGCGTSCVDIEKGPSGYFIERDTVGMR